MDPYSQKGGKPGLVRPRIAHLPRVEHERHRRHGKNCQADATCCSRWWRGTTGGLLDEVEAARQAEPVDEALDRFERRFDPWRPCSRDAAETLAM